MHDAKLTDDLIRPDDAVIFGDKGYVSNKRKPGRVLPAPQKKRNKKHGVVWAKAEHVFRVIKCQLGYRKMRYHGLAKSEAQMFSLMALVNLYLARRCLKEGSA